MLVSSLTAYLSPPFQSVLKYPLSLMTFIRRESGAIIFYHRNFTQNEKLRQYVDFLKSRLNAKDEVFLENARLKSTLYFKQKSPRKLIAARVIARSPDSWSSSVIIDKGRHNGIKRGMAVITYLGLIGRVIEAQDFTSRILLINDPNLGISGIVQRSRQEGLVSGTLGNYLIMKYLPEESDIKEQDVVVTSGLNQTYPKGLLIGTVVGIDKEFSGLGRFAIIKPAVNLSNIEEVLIIIS